MIGSLVKLENSYLNAQLVFFFVTRRNGPANWRGAWIENGQAQIGTRNDGSLFRTPTANRCARATFFEIACTPKSRRRASIASGVSVNPFYTSPRLGEHDDVDAIWSFTDEAGAPTAKALSIGNLNQVFTSEGRTVDCFDTRQAKAAGSFGHAVQIKNIWVPYGE